MKQTKVMLAASGLLLGVNQPAWADIYAFTGPDLNDVYTTGVINVSQLIPDNSPVGVGYGFDFTDAGVSVGDLSLNLDLSGGYNGDMYGYLQHNGTLIELFGPESYSADGASGSTLKLTLSSGSGLNPLSEATSINLASGLTYAAAGNLNGFIGADPEGLWTLYFADQGAGDTMTLNGFNLSITAVPEPQTWVLMSGGLATLILLRRRALL